MPVGYGGRVFDPAEFARSLLDVTEGVACAGTALESRSFATNKKAFLFVSKKELRLKLGASVAEAKRGGVAVGANGWAKIPAAEAPAAAVLRRWIAESHALMAPAAKAARGSSSVRRRVRGR
jgi:hypothetical protein